MKDRVTLPLLVVLGLWALKDQLHAALGWGYDSWQMSEWLINYRGGFVRRGLAGEIFWHLSDVTGIAVNRMVVVWSLACYIALVAWFLMNLRRYFHPVFLLSCLVLGFYAYQGAVVRKDCMGLLAMVACLGILRSSWPWLPRLLGMQVVACLAVLVHESFVFYAVVPMILLSMPEHPGKGGASLMRRAAVMSPALGCFLLVVWFRGSPEMAAKVHQSWMPLWETLAGGRDVPDLPAGAISALGWTISEGISPAWNLWTSGWYQPMAWVMVFSVAFASMMACYRDSGGAGMAGEGRIRLAALLVVQFVAVGPLFILGYDYGRWLLFWACGAMIAHAHGMRAPAWIEGWIVQAWDWSRAGVVARRVPVRSWYLLFFGVPVCWNAREFLHASPAGRHLGMLWEWLAR